jgi:hypothetical protein
VFFGHIQFFVMNIINTVCTVNPHGYQISSPLQLRFHKKLEMNESKEKSIQNFESSYEKEIVST